MAKDKRKSLGIKTSRYFTKACTKCKFEYPNWFTNCPKCGAAWDEGSDKDFISLSQKKTIKIVVKITDEDFDQELEQVILIFSADKGKSWYQMRMENKNEYFIVELSDVPTGSIIIYYVEVHLRNGEKVIENNEGKFYFYEVGSKIEEKPSNNMAEESKKFIKESQNESIGKKEYYKPQFFDDINPKSLKVKIPQNPTEYRKKENSSIFGKPLTEVDPDLKVCSNCSSKIKKMWSTCPICGKPT